MSRTRVPGCSVALGAAFGSADARAGAPDGPDSMRGLPSRRRDLAILDRALHRVRGRRPACRTFARAGRDRAGRGHHGGTRRSGAGRRRAALGGAADGAAAAGGAAAGGAARGRGNDGRGSRRRLGRRGGAAAAAAAAARPRTTRWRSRAPGRARGTARRRLLHLLHGVQRRLAGRDAGSGPVRREERPGDHGEVVALGRGLRGRGDEVLRGELEHHAVGERADRRGAWTAFEDGDLAERVALGVVAELALATPWRRPALPRPCRS